MRADTLYIIGNGFDLAHYLPTGYVNFREYLKKKAVEENEEEIHLLIDIFDKYDTEKKGNGAAAGEQEINWCDMEEYCGKIELSDAGIDLSDRRYYDEDGEEQIIPYTGGERGEEVDGFVKSIDKLRVLFNRWVETCGSQEQMKQAADHRIDYFTGKLQDPDYLILSFNYTNTLEQLYGVEENRICHIHGKQGSGGKYYFGHGDEVLSPDALKSLRKSLRYMNSIAYEDGTHFPDVEIAKKLFKDTKEAYNANKAFWDRLSDVKKVYAYGFSFGDVDLFYMEKIMEKVPTAEWHIHQYGEDAADKYCRIKRKLLEIHEDMDISFWDVNNCFADRNS